MAIYISGNKKIKNIFANVNGERKSISSVWVNKDNIPTKVFQLKNEESPDLYETAPADAYNNWNYTLNDEVNTITLNYYIGSETDVIVYGNYVINEKSYKTQIASNTTNNIASKYMFSGMSNIITIKFSKKIDTSNVTDMNCMFKGCAALTQLDLSNFNTSNVTNMRDMFCGCSKLTQLCLDSFNTINVTDMFRMFGDCHKLTSLDISGFDTKQVTNISNMFYNCKMLTNLNISNFNTSNVIGMANMFGGCTNLTILDLSNFETSNVTNMYGMFYYSSNLTKVLVSRNKWIIKLNCNRTNMFTGCGCNAVTYID